MVQLSGIICVIHRSKTRVLNGALLRWQRRGICKCSSNSMISFLIFPFLFLPRLTGTRVISCHLWEPSASFLCSYSSTTPIQIKFNSLWQINKRHQSAGELWLAVAPEWVKSFVCCVCVFVWLCPMFSGALWASQSDKQTDYTSCSHGNATPNPPPVTNV